jgi:hypothetical protein
MEQKQHWLQLLGRQLRSRVDRDGGKKKDELPSRWVELLLLLNEEERRRSDDRERR